MYVCCINACILEWMNAISKTGKVNKTAVTWVLVNSLKYLDEEEKILSFKVM